MTFYTIKLIYKYYTKYILNILNLTIIKIKDYIIFNCIKYRNGQE